MPHIKPYIIVPNLIDQPTWGGDYIATHKSLPLEENRTLGQAYELYESSFLSIIPSSQHPSLEYGDPTNPPQTTKAYSPEDNPFSIQELIDENPKKVLGSKPLQKQGSKIDLLIKFTQAKGNSYQLHVKRKTADGKWVPKPESWYYLEPGVLTLGARKDVDWDEYKKICLAVEEFVQKTGADIKAGKISYEEGKKAIQAFIQTNNPADFVNLVKVEANQCVDLSLCGMHHSWEDDPTMPWGNIVYEVQRNVYDPVSTIRAYDKGKIKPDGSSRPLEIEDYFTYIDRAPAANIPENYFGSEVKTSHYALERLTIDTATQGLTQDSYHHLFALESGFMLQTDAGELEITQGFSVFIPENIREYQVTPSKSTATILKTYIE